MNDQSKRLEEDLLFGQNRDSGFVAIEHVPQDAGPDQMALFVRKGDTVIPSSEPLTPFILMREEKMLHDCPVPFRVERLAGRNPFSRLVFFDSWKEVENGLAHLKRAHGVRPGDPSGPVLFINDPVQQHLLLTGRTLFKDMRFHDVRRMQIDIETYTSPGYEFSNAERKGDRITMMAMADSTGWVEVLSGKEWDEPEMLKRWIALVMERDPDVIEGHNLFNFDLPYLMARARLHKIKPTLGRDGRVPKVRASRFTTADRTVAYSRMSIFGRHVVDTYFLSLSYDVSHRSLEGHGLKEVARHFGVAAPQRTYLEGDQLSRVFEQEPDILCAYARDDVVETRAIADLLEPGYFIQAQMLPLGFQNVCVRGNGTKIDTLLLREYLRRRRAVAEPGIPRTFEGGYTGIFKTGVFHDVHHCDVRSLYPSIILKDRLGPRSDEEDVFLNLLEYLTRFRLEAKARMQTLRDKAERQHVDALQSTFKVLINSFYGYLGFEQGRFSDFGMAEKVAASGRAILKGMLAHIETLGGTPIEIDTDGIYFLPPPNRSEKEWETFRERFKASLPDGIEVEFDGQFKSMFSYKIKNYALLDDAGELIVKGASLKSRGLEPFQRSFMREWLLCILEERKDDIATLYREYRDAIENRKWPIRMLAKSETLKEAPSTYQAKIAGKGRGRNAAYELALQSGREYRAGDQVSYYVTGTTKKVPVHANARLVSDWNPNRRDENVPYYLAKLDALLHKFDMHSPADDKAAHPELDFGAVAREDE